MKKRENNRVIHPNPKMSKCYPVCTDIQHCHHVKGVKLKRLDPLQLLKQWKADRESTVLQLENVADGYNQNRKKSWKYPVGVLNVICDYTLQWYTRRTVRDIVIHRGELYLFQFQRNNKENDKATEPVQFVLNVVDGNHMNMEQEQNENEFKAMECVRDHCGVDVVDVFNWGVKYGESVCVNQKASGREWNKGDMVHVQVDTRSDSDGLEKCEMELWITSNGVCSRGICIEMENGKCPLKMEVNGQFQFATGVKVW